FKHCLVGTGTSTPVATESTLASFLASHGSSVKGTSYNSSSPYQTTHTWTFLFNIGAVVGNVSDVGVGPQGSNGNLASRSLIVDGGGNPTTISVLADEQIEIQYIFHLYPPLGDVQKDILINGATHSTTSRALAVATSSWTLGQFQPTFVVGAQSYYYIF